MVDIKIVKINKKMAEVKIGEIKIGCLTYSLMQKKLYLHDNNGSHGINNIKEVEKYVNDNYTIPYLEKSQKALSYRWEVEQYNRETNQLEVIGEILLNSETIHLSNFELEEIWDLCNFSVSDPETKFIICPLNEYDGRQVYISNYMKYINFCPTRAASGVVNCDIFIHPCLSKDKGYYLKADRKSNIDKWVYTEKRDEAIFQISSNF